MKNLITCIFLTFLMQGAFAHPGGHHHHNIKTRERTWNYKDGRIAAKGAFLSAKGQTILVEDQLPDLKHLNQQSLMVSLILIRNVHFYCN